MSGRETSIDDFLIAHGGAFYELQKRLRLLHDRALRSGPRALLFVALAWGVPLLLSVLAGHAFGPFADRPYLLSLGVWARFLIAVAIFVLMERQVEERLRAFLRHFVRAPLLAPVSFAPAAEAVTQALRRRDSLTAELVCFGLACGVTIISAFNMLDIHASSWAVHSSAEAKAFTAAGWWSLIVSSPIFWFLLFRWLWRLLVWSLLLRALARLELRLVATHPDGYGGLAFIGRYPNAYAAFVFAISCVVGAALAEALLKGAIAAATYGYVMVAWLAIVFILLAFPLHAFSRVLSELREQTLLVSSAQATQYHRAVERGVLGRNISASDDAESVPAADIADPDKTFSAAKSISTLLFSRSALLPVSAAALIPLVAGGATQLPMKELMTIVKRLLVL